MDHIGGAETRPLLFPPEYYDSLKETLFYNIRIIDELHESIRGQAAIQVTERPISPVDHAIGSSLLDLWHRSHILGRPSPYEHQLAEFAQSCSAEVIDQVFRDFKKRQWEETSLAGKVATVIELNRLKSSIEKLSREVTEAEKLLSQKKGELEAAESSTRETRPSGTYIYHMADHPSLPSREKLDEEERICFNIAQQQLGGCPDGVKPEAGCQVLKALARDLLQSREIGEISGEVMHEIFRQVQKHFLVDQGVAGFALTEKKGEVDTLSVSLIRKKADLNECRDKLALLESFYF